MAKIHKIARSAAFAVAALLGLSWLTGTCSACDVPVYRTSKHVSYYHPAPRSVTYYSAHSVRRSKVYRVRSTSYRAVRIHVTRYGRVAY